MSELIPTKADQEIAECIAAKQSFAMIAGAGSGKTTSLVTALKCIRDNYSSEMRRNSQKVACITYTKRAVEVIAARLEHDELYLISTLHSFLWNEIKKFTRDIRDAVATHRIPQLIEKAREDDNGGTSKKALKARDRILGLEEQIVKMVEVSSFRYEDSTSSKYSEGQLSHDDIIEVAGYFLAKKPTFRTALGYRYPFIFVDEAQDTFQYVVDGLNLVAGSKSLPVIGYFGDPWQQIYEENRAGDFAPPPNGKTITKVENFRCSERVIELLNAFRNDVQQIAAGDNKGKAGSVQLALVRAESPTENRGRYSEEQIERALQHLDAVLAKWDWSNRTDVKKLYLVRQMIARRMGFPRLNSLFTGRYTSQAAKENYEKGEHFLITPFLRIIRPLVSAKKRDDSRAVVDMLRRNSPAFDIHGNSKNKPLSEMITLANSLITELVKHWDGGTVRDVLRFCKDSRLMELTDRLSDHLTREPRTEEYDEEEYGQYRGDWLCDDFFKMTTAELNAYCDFVEENTPFSTQHGVKGEEYKNVLVVFDDVEASWSQYSFNKLLTPNTAGGPTDGQLARSRKLAYVCFSRAMENLRIVLFTSEPEKAKKELIDRKLFCYEQIEIFDSEL